MKTTVWSGWLAFLMLTFGFLVSASAVASADTRSLKLYFVHTGEKAEIVFKRNGRYDPAGLQQVNRFLRDWRRNEPTKMDPRLLDLVWEAYRQSGSSQYITVICGYRSPATNSMLRSRSKGVAQKSQHMLGKAMDFYIPDVKLKTLRDIGLRLQGGGVGYYPRSGSPFVHMDVGNVRHWPKMSRQELVAVFPKGNTLHVPSDGKPLPGFEQALAAYNARKSTGNLAIASAAGTTKKSSRGLLAAFFGGGADEDEDNASSGGGDDDAPVAAPAAKAEPQKQIATAPEKPDIRIVPPELAKPAEMPQEQLEEPQPPESIIAALPQRGVPLPGVAPRPQVGVGEASPATVPFQVASGIDDPNAQPPKDEVALNIPLPTRRPSYTPPPELVADDAAKHGDAVSALLAMADTGTDDSTASVPMPSSRPDEDDPSFIVAALPASRPTLQALSDANPIAVAPASPATAAYAPDDDGDDPYSIPPADAVGSGTAMKGARILTVSASPRAALEASLPGTDPATAMASGVRTTAKSAKPRSGEAKRDPRPVVLAAQPQAARWAMSTDTRVSEVAQGTKAPSFAYNIVRTAPQEVYTAGFQAETKVADANRFTGKAVEFMSLARFNQN